MTDKVLRHPNGVRLRPAPANSVPEYSDCPMVCHGADYPIFHSSSEESRDNSGNYNSLIANNVWSATENNANNSWNVNFNNGNTNNNNKTNNNRVRCVR